MSDLTPDAKLDRAKRQIADAIAEAVEAILERGVAASADAPDLELDLSLFRVKHGSCLTDGSGTVYFIEAVGADFIKIGWTERPVSERLSDLQTASPHPLRVLRTLTARRDAERFFHERFEALHVRGEWFRATPELRRYISAGNGAPR